MYTRYIAEPLGGEKFLTRKFNTRIIFTAKISQSTVQQTGMHMKTLVDYVICFSVHVHAMKSKFTQMFDIFWPSVILYSHENFWL